MSEVWAKQNRQHSPDCFAEQAVQSGDWASCWAMTSGEWERRDRMGRENQGGDTLFYRLRCNDRECPAEVIIRADVFEEAILAVLASKGAPGDEQLRALAPVAEQEASDESPDPCQHCGGTAHRYSYGPRWKYDHTEDCQQHGEGGFFWRTTTEPEGGQR